MVPIKIKKTERVRVDINLLTHSYLMTYKKLTESVGLELIIVAVFVFTTTKKPPKLQNP